MPHTCHAAGCSVRTRPEMFMCKRHWFMLPKHMRDDIWRTYRPGQCDDWEISHEYAEAARIGVLFVAAREGIVPPDPRLREALLVYDMLDPVRYEPRTIAVTRGGKRVVLTLS